MIKQTQLNVFQAMNLNQILPKKKSEYQSGIWATEQKFLFLVRKYLKSKK